MENPRDERMCDVFDMLIDRMTAVEETNKSLQRHNKNMMNLLLRSARMDDSQRKLGKPFCGTSWADRCVALTIHDQFDDNGEFNGVMENDILIVHDERYLNRWCDKFDFALFKTDDEWVLGDYVIEVWGLNRYLQVRKNIKSWYAFNQNAIWRSRTGPTNADVDIMADDGVEDAIHSMYNVAFRQKYIGFSTLCSYGLELNMVDLFEAIKIVDNVTRDLKSDLAEEIEIHQVPRELRMLALSIIHNGGNNETSFAWLRLTRIQRRALIANMDNENTLFTRDNLLGCDKDV